MDRTELLLLKREVINTTNSIGWHYVLKIADELVKSAEAAVIQEQNETKIVGLQRKAQAAREFLNQFRQKIEATRQVDTEDASPEDLLLYEVACD